MKVLVTGSAGHLGEALVRTLRDRGHEAVGLDVLPGALHRRMSARSPTAPSCGRPWPGVAGGAPRRDAAQAACRHPWPAGFRRHQHHRHAQPAGGGGGGRRRRLRLHQHHQRLRRRAGAARRRPGRLDRPRRSCRCRRTSTASPRPRPRTCASCSTATRACPAIVLRTSRFFPEDDDDGAMRDGLCRRQRQGERVPVPPRRHRGCGRGPSAGAGAGAGDRLRPLHRQRHHAVPAGGPGGAAPRRAGGGAAARSRATRPNMRAAAGGCSRASTGSMSTSGRARTRLAAAPRLRGRDRPAAGGRRAGEPAGPAGRVKGYHAETFAEGPLSGGLTRGRAQPANNTHSLYCNT